jgi:hypothetical protein
MSICLKSHKTGSRHVEPWSERGPSVQDEENHELDTATGDLKVAKVGLLGHLFRFFGWWFAFAGISSISVCPFCGQTGCPVGASSAGILGGLMALLVQLKNWRVLIKSIKNRFFFKGE